MKRKEDSFYPPKKKKSELQLHIPKLNIPQMNFAQEMSSNAIALAYPKIYLRNRSPLTSL